ncbi:MAG: ATP-grasp domain-containing protein [Candidatus Pacebacteria bacterium]|nr:ATP-grasp domain-containing protein [Candidatus Paceibacterota bacterium]
MLDNKIIKFLEDSGPIFYVTPAAGRAIGLEGLLPDFHIICCQKTENAELIRKAGAKFFCLEKDLKNSGRILSDPGVVDYIKNNTQGKTPNIITFKPSPMIEKVCEKNGFRYLGNKSEINREWEDKIKFAEITTALDVANANSRTVRIEKENMMELENSLDFSRGKRYAVQFSRGYSGNSTFVVDGREKLSEILEKNLGRKVKIADFVEGDTYTFNVCIGEFGFLVSQPIFQITGFPECNRNAMGTCGNDFAFGSRLGSDSRDDSRASIKSVAQKIASVGYRGILGFDFVVGSDGVHLIEVNPRLVGSIPIFTKLQLSDREVPFLLLHILSFLDFNFLSLEAKEPKSDFVFSQLILRNVKSKPLTIIRPMRSGIYKMDGDVADFVREAYYADGEMAGGEFFLECVPAGELIEPDMEYANIQVGYGIMETRNGFTEEFTKTKESVLKNIILS